MDKKQFQIKSPALSRVSCLCAAVFGAVFFFAAGAFVKRVGATASPERFLGDDDAHADQREESHEDD
ncbi:MAG: hypothetical protein WCO69_01375 [Candidatus Omnitrophota bacterium]